MADSAKKPESEGLIFLIGPRGAGKTTVGRELAKTMEWNFADADDVIQQQEGCTIQQIFQSNGEEAFRDLETNFLAGCVGQRKQVFSLGGGAVVRQKNRDLIKKAGKAVYLSANVEVLANRIQEDPRSAATRPTLSDAGTGSVKQQMIELNRKRQSFYNEVAHWVIDTSGLSVMQIVSEILQRIAADVPKDTFPTE